MVDVVIKALNLRSLNPAKNQVKEKEMLLNASKLNHFFVFSFPLR